MESSTSTSITPARLQLIIRWLFLGALPGIATGIIVGGVGSRIVMRIVGAMEGSVPHQETDFGFTVGSITVFGMVVLIILFGSASGFVGGLIYMCVRPWLGAKQRWRGLYFGTVLLLAGGGLVIESGNTDFVRFGSSSVNILLFGMLFMLFGILISPIVEWADDHINFASPQREIPRSGQVTLGIGFLVAAVPLAMISLFVFTGLLTDSVKIVIPVLFLLLIPIAFLTNQDFRKAEPNSGSRFFFAGYALIGVICLLGLALGLQAISEIQECAETLSSSGSQFTAMTQGVAEILCD